MLVQVCGTDATRTRLVVPPGFRSTTWQLALLFAAIQKEMRNHLSVPPEIGTSSERVWFVPVAVATNERRPVCDLMVDRTYCDADGRGWPGSKPLKNNARLFVIAPPVCCWTAWSLETISRSASKWPSCPIAPCPATHTRRRNARDCADAEPRPNLCGSLHAMRGPNRF